MLVLNRKNDGAMARKPFQLPWLTLALLAGPGFGQPIDIRADRFEMLLDERKTTYTGHVVAVQGERRLVGDVLVVRFTEDDRVASMRALGSPARLTDAGQDPPLSLSAATLSYEFEEALVRAEGGVLTRGEDSVSAEIILYDLEREEAQALGQEGSRVKLRWHRP